MIILAENKLQGWEVSEPNYYNSQWKDVMGNQLCSSSNDKA